MVFLQIHTDRGCRAVGHFKGEGFSKFGSRCAGKVHFFVQWVETTAAAAGLIGPAGNRHRSKRAFHHAGLGLEFAGPLAALALQGVCGGIMGVEKLTHHHGSSLLQGLLHERLRIQQGRSRRHFNLHHAADHHATALAGQNRIRNSGHPAGCSGFSTTQATFLTLILENLGNLAFT